MMVTHNHTHSYIPELLPSYETSALGIPAVLKNIVTRHTCTLCGDVLYEFPTDGILEETIAMLRCLIPVKLAGKEIRFIRKALGMTAKEFVEKIAGDNPHTLSRWEHESQGVGGYADLVIRSNACALLKDSVSGVAYDPRMFVGMKVISGATIGSVTIEAHATHEGRIEYREAA